MISDDAVPPIPDSDDEVCEAPLDDFLSSEVGETQKRLWLKAVIPYLHARDYDNPIPRVQFALDRVRIAACERVIRILTSDLDPDESA